MLTAIDPIADFLARGGRVNICPPMPAMGDFRPPQDVRAKGRGGRKAPMSAAEIAAIPAALPAVEPERKRAKAITAPKVAVPPPERKVATKRPRRANADDPPPCAAAAARMAQAGMSITEIAASLGVRRETASSYLSTARANGMDVRRFNARPGGPVPRVRKPPVPGTPLPPTTAAVVALKSSGLSHRQTAEVLDTTIAAVKWHVRFARMCDGAPPSGLATANRERDARILAAHTAGDTRHVIAQREGISKARVSQIIARARKVQAHG